VNLRYLVYLGYIVGGGELKIDPSKVETIMNWSKPNNINKVRSFLGQFNIRGSSLLTFIVLHILYLL